MKLADNNMNMEDSNFDHKVQRNVDSKDKVFEVYGQYVNQTNSSIISKEVIIGHGTYMECNKFCNRYHWYWIDVNDTSIKYQLDIREKSSKNTESLLVSA